MYCKCYVYLQLRIGTNVFTLQLQSHKLCYEIVLKIQVEC